MDDLVQRAIKESEAKKKSSVPWEFDKPWQQVYYIYSTDQKTWLPNDPSNTPDAQRHISGSISRLSLYSWNIDFMLPCPDSRMRAALRHLESLVRHEHEDTASVIFLQECLESDLEVLAADDWVKRTFALTDRTTNNWQSGHYGTCTLVDRRLPITSCFRVHYSQTRMQRDGLFVDVLLGPDEKVIIRLCNSHLESLALEPPYRPPQIQLCARYMHDLSIHGAVAAGDFNAIQDFDLHLHSNNNLKDAYLELGGREGDREVGHTWGQQAATVQRERFGTSRMDKVFYCRLRCVLFQRFGAGVQLENEAERDRIVRLGFEKPWITDHLGVKAVFELDNVPNNGRGSSL